MRGVGWAASRVRTLVSGVQVVHARRGFHVPRAVALTFDDGPSESTPAVLDALRPFGARATFFVLGASIDGRESTLRQAVAEGHELGNHAFSHMPPEGLDDDALRAELLRTSGLIEAAVGRRPSLFRPPYAAYDVRVARVAREAGLAPTVLRSIDPADWREEDPGEIARHVLARARPGAIVCLHDAHPPLAPAGATDRAVTVAALEPILEGLAARELRAVTVSELLA
jgi:peptidoglycan/xylan/chitin deacetylase (PgdA/CDA1 family)